MRVPESQVPGSQCFEIVVTVDEAVVKQFQDYFKVSGLLPEGKLTLRCRWDARLAMALNIFDAMAQLETRREAAKNVNTILEMGSKFTSSSLFRDIGGYAFTFKFVSDKDPDCMVFVGFRCNDFQLVREIRDRLLTYFEGLVEQQEQLLKDQIRSLKNPQTASTKANEENQIKADEADQTDSEDETFLKKTTENFCEKNEVISSSSFAAAPSSLWQKPAGSKPGVRELRRDTLSGKSAEFFHQLRAIRGDNAVTLTTEKMSVNLLTVKK